MKVTEPGLNKLIDNLNTLICEDSLLTRQERETLVLAVAAIGAMKGKRKLTAVCSHQTRIGNLDAHLI
ncbi:hypothetical protein F9865_27175 (plasmid) [Klebsiella pneumoniae subsp. pneumoniae]|nr:hypothetical protein F9865_27175 [Klebsiella pneumoniae subsp. pneumoniae]